MNQDEIRKSIKDRLALMDLCCKNKPYVNNINTSGKCVPFAWIGFVLTVVAIVAVLRGW